jgi:bifunctional non-homologous end joining protein LigD
MGEARCRCGIAGTGSLEGDNSPQAVLKAGNMKFRLEGERLHGNWVLVRMKQQRRSGGNRNNGY